ncbi:hypothetical protein FE257_001669 [Aspergillus nanangensis]|uniref:Tat pathway signal sequence n=1 Tax=Aspergillus nanangensis TaxID=2582783 RepID=A0AAD4CTS3_ASPNN|nr:hypothetical protein FE257_001669 [Aspergillus nanangensis]
MQWVNISTYDDNEVQNYTGPFYAMSPAREAAVYEKVISRGGMYQENAYKGPPSPERDAVWNKLLEPIDIRVSKDTLEQLNITGLELNDHSGYYGGLNVYHHLHCLRYIRGVMRQEHFHNKPTNDPEFMEHVYHCIDDIRQALMCNPDLSIYTWTWIPGDRKPRPMLDIPQECVNWDKLNSWASDRSFDVFEPNLLVHPELGSSFPVVDRKLQSSALSNETGLAHPRQDFHDHSADASSSDIHIHT